MAQKVITRLEDDLDGSEAAETVSFAIDGAQYEIDLSAPNAATFRKALDEYVTHGRKVGGRTRKTAAATGSNLKAVRAWAAMNGIEVSARGRVPRSVIDQYHAAGN